MIMSVYGEIDETGEIKENMHKAWSDFDFRIFVWSFYIAGGGSLFVAMLVYIIQFIIFLGA